MGATCRICTYILHVSSEIIHACWINLVCLFTHLLYDVCFRYGTGTLTNVFLDLVFQECLTYEGEMVRSRLNFKLLYNRTPVFPTAVYMDLM